jgi:BirA family biotin operon repressor/biotin-[acetyl-CoA-carboxylase] ligase
MKSPTANGEKWAELDNVETTQAYASQYLRSGEPIGVVFAHEQTAGKGRLGRTWVSRQGDSLTFSLIFRAYADHPKPYLIGMAAALAAAGVLRSQIRWPNDLVFGPLKVGGILTELMQDENGRLVPVVGIGINLNQEEFPPEIASIATSLSQARGGQYDPQLIAHRIVERLATLPEPTSWADLSPIWSLFDFTPGKQYKLTTGEQAIALGIGSEGQLLCSVDGESRAVLAAEALFGQ